MDTTDTLSMQDKISHAITQNSSSRKQFLYKLFSVLEDTSYPNIITWSNDGKKVLLHSPNAIAEFVLPKVFNHNNYSSFVRQLNFYGFKRTYEGVVTRVYYHACFQRGKIELLDKIERTKHKSASKSKSNPNNSLQENSGPDSSGDALEAVQRELEEARMQIKQLRHENQALTSKLKRYESEKEVQANTNQFQVKPNQLQEQAVFQQHDPKQMYQLFQLEPNVAPFFYKTHPLFSQQDPSMYDHHHHQQQQHHNQQPQLQQQQHQHQQYQYQQCNQQLTIANEKMNFACPKIQQMAIYQANPQQDSAQDNNEKMSYKLHQSGSKSNSSIQVKYSPEVDYDDINEYFTNFKSSEFHPSEDYSNIFQGYASSA